MRLCVVVLVACGAAPAYRERPPGGLEAIDPGTSAPALLSARSCQGCHATQHAEWAGSRHAQAWTNGIFHREYRERPSQWCVNCHAPLAQQVADTDGELAREGVGCAACHVRAGRIVAQGKKPGSPHDTVVSATFGTPSFCAGCHEFGFPVISDDGEVRKLTAHPMQATVSQFERGPFAQAPEGCRTCHEPGHTYRGGHDLDMLRRALDFKVCRDSDAIVLTLANRGAGHNVPTGDVHRHLNVRAWRSSAPEGLTELFFGRRFEPSPDGGKRTTWDSTLRPRESRSFRVLPATLGEDGPIRFSVDYVYTPDENPAAGHDPGEPTAAQVASLSSLPEELPPCEK